MITFTSISNLSVSINPKQVSYVQEGTIGCVIFFTSGLTLSVKDKYLDVVGALKAQ